MNTPPILTAPTRGFLNVAAYLTIAGVGLVSLATTWGMVPLEQMLVAVSLFVLFTILEIVLLITNTSSFPRLRLLLATIAVTVFALIVLLRSPYVPILFFLPVAQVFLFLSAREAFVWTVIYTALIASATVLFDTMTTAIVMALVFGGGFVFFGAVTTSFRSEQAARAKSEKLLQELETAHTQLREYAARVEELTIAEERNRIAREIHDSLGHHLTLLSVQLQAASKLVAREPERATNEIEKARAVVADALQAVRQSVSALRATTRNELRPAEAIARLAQEFQTTTGIVVNFSADDASAFDDLSPAHATTLFRAAQEGLTNAHKHARANRVDIALERTQDQLRLTITDNGVGKQDDAGAGFGLLGLHERVELLDGKLSTRNKSDGGFELCIELPVEKNRNS